MRRRVVLSSAALVCLSAGVSAPAAAHAPSPSTQAGAGAAVCSPDSKTVNEISGLVATQSGYYAIQDSQPAPARPKIFTLDSACKSVKQPITLSKGLDPEDAAVGKDGTLYVAD